MRASQHSFEVTMNRLTLFTTACIIALFGTECIGKITAPSYCANGELAVLESDAPATWIVYPADYKASFYVVEGGRICIFASPNKGSVTFIAATMRAGQSMPEISTHTLYNGVSPDEDIEDEAEPEPVDDSTLAGVAKTEVSKVESDKKNDELEALSKCFSEVVSGIERGTVRTTEGARATFRALWAAKACKVSGETLRTWEQAITAISAKIDNTSLTTIKRDYSELAEVLDGLQEKAEAAPDEADEPAEQKEQSSCPNGRCQNCPNGQCPVQNGSVQPQTRFWYR